MMTNKRLSYMQAAPQAGQALLSLSAYGSKGSSLDEGLLNLVQLRASQINGCGFCTVLHVNDARDAGETDERLHTLAVWREVPYFNERERIALEFTEKLTDLAHNEIEDELYARGAAEFGERGLADLAFAIATINMWNRMNVAFCTPPDPRFRSKSAHAAAHG